MGFPFASPTAPLGILGTDFSSVCELEGVFEPIATRLLECLIRNGMRLTHARVKRHLGQVLNDKERYRTSIKMVNDCKKRSIE